MNAMVQVAQRMTADEYLAIPYDGRRTMLVDGEIVVNEPGMLHQLVLADLFDALRGWVTAQAGRGRVTWPVDVKLDERTVVGPDLLWYAQGRVPARRAPRPYAVPDIAAEVRSSSTWHYDVGAKKSAYERAGLGELWLVDTVACEILVYRRSSPGAPRFDVSRGLTAEDELTSPQLSGFAIALSALFAD